MKDNFSNHSKEYALFRPHYPVELLTGIFSLLKEKNTAWDCGTGNGQVAGILADYFDNVYATDISGPQLEYAVKKSNIYYSVQSAEKTLFEAGRFNLVTVAQAIHWFRFDEFYAEVKRVSKPGAIIAVIGYGLLQTEEPLQTIIAHFYQHTIGPYWDAERRYIDEGYQTIQFPFKEIKMPGYKMAYEWTLEQLTGYINTWSAVKHYIQQHNQNPVNALEKELARCWKGRPAKSFSFPLLLRVGRV